jgi:hypothetical protein
VCECTRSACDIGRVEQLTVVNALRLASWLARLVSPSICLLHSRRAVVQWAFLRSTARLTEALAAMPYYHLVLTLSIQLVEILYLLEPSADNSAYEARD